jgi:hypothetical protein
MTMLGCLLLMGISSERRRVIRAAGLLICLAMIFAGLSACGGGNGGNPGTTPGAYTIAVTGSSGTTTATSRIALTVQ